MNRYHITFQRLKKEKRMGFCPFAVLGDPTKQASFTRIKKYLQYADFLELGIPFSDPIADGPVIQAADTRAIVHGMTPKKALSLVKRTRQLNQHIPIGILTYANIIFRYGIQKFYRDLSAAGADSVLLADVPLEEIRPFVQAAKKNHIHQIFLISEYTTPARLAQINTLAGGFLYITSLLGVTGARKTLNKNLAPLLKTLHRHTSLPLMVGFGISSPAHIRQLKKLKHISGAITGSALVETPPSKLTSVLCKLRTAFQ